MPHFFKSILIQNLLSFGPDSPELELKPINIVIGPNGSGKSNLLAALSLFRSQKERHSIIENSGGVQNWYWMSDTECQETKIKVIFESAQKWNECSFVITLKKEQNFHPSGWWAHMTVPKDIDIIAPGTDGKRIITTVFSIDYLDNNHLDSGHYLKNAEFPAVHADSIKKSIDEFRDSFFFFRDWQYGPAAPIRTGPQPIGLSNNWIRGDARNLAHVLKRIKSDERSYYVFMDFLSELYEDIDDIQFTEAEDFLFFFVIENGRKVPAARISDGTLRYLALLAVLCDPEPPHLICLEEPEMGLHPDLIQIVAKAIRYASERAQIIATTHSVSLVDNFTDSPESIVVCEKIDGSTELRRLDPEEMKPWLEKYRLGNLWTSGQIGGNRW